MPVSAPPGPYVGVRGWGGKGAGRTSVGTWCQPRVTLADLWTSWALVC